jgi:RNA polymerase sigma-70 factor (ECF subfamily)
MESIGFIQDGSLVRKAQGGDQAAFAQLVRTYDQAVLRLALRLTGSESDAQDIHQEAFLKVYKKRSNKQPLLCRAGDACPPWTNI